MKRRAVFAAVCLAVLAPAGVLAVSYGSGRAAGCAVRYSTGPDGQMRLALTLAQPGSIEARAGGGVVTRTEPAGVSVLMLPGAAGAPSVTDFTADGELMACSVARGG